MSTSSEDAAVFLVIGLVLGVITVCCVATTMATLRRRRRWARAHGEVTGHAKRTTTSTDSTTGTTTSTYYVSRYRFVDAQGTVRTGVDEGGAKRPAGTAIRVMYDPASPEVNEAVGLGRTLLVGTVLSLLALPLTLYLVQWGFAGVLGVDPLVEISDPRRLWLDESQIER